MSFEGTKLVGLSGGMLFLGLVGGLAVPSGRVKHNHISFIVDPTTTKVSLYPKVGDVIRWYEPDKSSLSGVKRITPQFDEPGYSPCDPQNPNDCVVVKPAYPIITWNYSCQYGNPSTPCFDPVIGPVSAKGIGGGISGFPTLKRFTDFRDDDDQDGTITSPPPPPQGKSPQKTKALVISTVSVSCSKPTPDGVLQVYVTSTGLDGSLTLSAADTNRIGWSPKVDGFSIVNPLNGNQPLCVEAGPFNENQGCTVISQASGTYTYTVTSPSKSCKSSKTESIVVVD